MVANEQRVPRLLNANPNPLHSFSPSRVGCGRGHRGFLLVSIQQQTKQTYRTEGQGRERREAVPKRGPFLYHVLVLAKRCAHAARETGGTDSESNPVYEL